MAVDRNVVKNLNQVGQMVFEYKPRELNVETSQSAKDYVANDGQKSPDFKISELVSKQAGIAKLESEVHEEEINERVLDRMKEIEERAYREGYDLGLIDGRDKAFQEEKINLSDRLNKLEVLLAEIENQRQQLLIENEVHLVELIFQIAKKIALRDLSEHREAVVEILKHAVDDLVNDERVVIHVSPEDLQFIQNVSEKSEKKMDKIKKLKIVEDEKLKSGGCLLETSFGSVDATVDERVSRAWELLKDRLPQKRRDPGA